jgi:Carboxypeptidase regulatory-like domain
MKTFAALTIALALVATLSATAAGQEFRGAITGRVNDRSGGVLPGVTVTATNVATNVSSTTVTTGEGLFTIPYLTPGTYQRRFRQGDEPDEPAARHPARDEGGVLVKRWR